MSRPDAPAAGASAGASPATPATPASPATPRLCPVGLDALLLDLDGLDAAMAWHAELIERPLDGQVEALAAASTVLLRFASRAHAVAARVQLARRTPGTQAAAAPRTHTIEVAYSGEDLAEVARLTGLSVEGVVAAHSGTPWRGAFGGFAPGFTYLSGGDPVLDVPRRSSPRTAVPAGSVAIAGRLSAVYPRTSPGGWQLLGTTSATLWDAARTSPALIAPGDVVRFVPVHDVARLASGAPAPSVGAREEGEVSPAAAAPAVEEPRPAAGLTVLSPGLRTLIEDAGRPGRGDLGVTVSGAADAPSLAQANRLVGNRRGAAGLETLLGGLELRAESVQVLALAGAVGEARIVDEYGRESEAPVRAPFALYPGHTLRLGSPESGLRGYVAVRGGLDVATELGSAATDTLSGLGPAALAAGQELRVARATGTAVVGQAEDPATALPAAGETVTLRAVAGPRDDWFGPAGLDALQELSWRVTAQSDRVGARLELDPGVPGQEALRRVLEGELPSEGVVAGALQVPPSGLPVLFLADHPVTGGYPVIAVVLPADVARAAQLPPGTSVRIALVDPDRPDAAPSQAAPAPSTQPPQPSRHPQQGEIS